MADCNKCILQKDIGYGVCTRQNINKIDGYCWLEPYVRDCFKELGYESHDCIFCEHHTFCQELRKKEETEKHLEKDWTLDDFNRCYE